MEEGIGKLEQSFLKMKDAINDMMSTVEMMATIGYSKEDNRVKSV